MDFRSQSVFSLKVVKTKKSEETPKVTENKTTIKKKIGLETSA